MTNAHTDNHPEVDRIWVIRGICYDSCKNHILSTSGWLYICAYVGICITPPRTRTALEMPSRQLQGCGFGTTGSFEDSADGRRAQAVLPENLRVPTEYMHVCKDTHIYICIYVDMYKCTRREVDR